MSYVYRAASFKRLLRRPTTWSDADRREHGCDYLLIRTVQGDGAIGDCGCRPSMQVPMLLRQVRRKRQCDVHFAWFNEFQ